MNRKPDNLSSYGIFTMMYNCYAIVCSNKRLLFINVNSRITHPTHSLFQMLYEDIKKAKQGLLLNHLILYQMSGKRRIFRSVKRYFSKELRGKTIVALNFGLHWDTKEGYKSMETPVSCFAGLIF